MTTETLIAAVEAGRDIVGATDTDAVLMFLEESNGHLGRRYSEAIDIVASVLPSAARQALIKTWNEAQPFFLAGGEVR